MEVVVCGDEPATACRDCGERRELGGLAVRGRGAGELAGARITGSGEGLDEFGRRGA
jgi:hypothetical protein